MLAYPHFGLSLGLCFHSQGLTEFSRQLHVVAVAVKTGISWALGSPSNTGWLCRDICFFDLLLRWSV